MCDETLIGIEEQVRSAVRDAVNLASRKPFHWGGLTGYQQLEAIRQSLVPLRAVVGAHPFWQPLMSQMDRALEKNRTLALDVLKAHQKLERVAAVLRYPPSKYTQKEKKLLTPEQVAKDMEALLQAFHAEPHPGQAQIALSCALKKAWNDYGQDLLPCYALPGLPQDNLKLESRFGLLRRNQRRISGRKSTRELHDFGHCQILFGAENEADLLEQLQQVPYQDYRDSRKRLDEAEAPRRFIHRLHHDPRKTSQDLITKYLAHRQGLAQTIPP